MLIDVPCSKTRMWQHVEAATIAGIPPWLPWFPIIIEPSPGDLGGKVSCSFLFYGGVYVAADGTLKELIHHYKIVLRIKLNFLENFQLYFNFHKMLILSNSKLKLFIDSAHHLIAIKSMLVYFYHHMYF